VNLDITNGMLISAEENGGVIHMVIACTSCSQLQTRALRPLSSSVRPCTGRRCDEKITITLRK